MDKLLFLDARLYIKREDTYPAMDFLVKKGTCDAGPLVFFFSCRMIDISSLWQFFNHVGLTKTTARYK